MVALIRKLNFNKIAGLQFAQTSPNSVPNKDSTSVREDHKEMAAWRLLAPILSVLGFHSKLVSFVILPPLDNYRINELISRLES